MDTVVTIEPIPLVCAVRLTFAGERARLPSAGVWPRLLVEGGA
jgi:hypothetical protein